jgi:hypothetical protein
MFVPSACVCRILHLCGERERLARMHTRRAASVIYICPNLFILCRVIQFFTLHAHNIKGEMRQSRMRISIRTTPAADASDFLFISPRSVSARARSPDDGNFDLRRREKK